MPLLIEGLILLIVVGAVLYVLDTHVPMAPPFKVAIRVIAILLPCLWLLWVAGLYSGRIFR